jgi:hypothetical protein
MTSGKTITAATIETIHKTLVGIGWACTPSSPDFLKAKDISL